MAHSRPQDNGQPSIQYSNPTHSTILNAACTYRKDMQLPELYGTKALDIRAHSCCLRWTFLSTHSLSRQQLLALVYEIKSTDSKLQTEARFNRIPPKEFKTRILGLEANTRYKFRIRCRLKHNGKILHSQWSNPIQFTTTSSEFIALTDEQNVGKALEYKQRCDELVEENSSLRQKLMEYLPPHLQWDHQEVLQWMMSIENGRLKQYKQDLRKNIEAEDLVGSRLHELNHFNHLYRLGVSKLRHQKILLTYLQSLTANDSEFTKYLASPCKKQPCETPVLNDDEMSPELPFDDDLIERGMIGVRSSERLYPLSEVGDDDNPNQSNPAENVQSEIDDERNNGSRNDNCNLQSDKLKKEDLINNEDPDNDDSKTDDFLYDDLAKQDLHRSVSYSISVGLGSPHRISSVPGVTKSVRDMLFEGSDSPKWKYENGVLSVFVQRATNLDNKDAPNYVFGQMFGNSGCEASDPYVQLELQGQSQTMSERTKHIENEENPVWNERFQLFPDDPKNDVLRITVWDKDTWTPDDLIGTVFIRVNDVLNANGHIKQAFDIDGSKTGAKIYLELKYKELGAPT